MSINEMRSFKLDHKKMGFDPGDDDKLQAAMHKNLNVSASDAFIHGDKERHKRITEDMDAIEELRKEDEISDPNDEKPDYPIGGYKAVDL